MAEWDFVVVLYVNGKEEQYDAQFGEQIGTILETEIPDFVKALGSVIQASGLKFDEWYAEKEDTFKEIAAPYVTE